MQKDITATLYHIKENIKAVENRDVNNVAILREIEAGFFDLMELIKLFLISKRDSYYGYFYMNMAFQVNFFAPCIAGIQLNTFPAVFESNPLLLCHFSLKEIIYIVCHEIDHIVLNHPAEGVRINPENDPDIHEKLNIAMDAAINDRLDNEIAEHELAYMSTPDWIVNSNALKEMFNLKKVRALENYLYYYNLIKDATNEELKSGQDKTISKFGKPNENDNLTNANDQTETIITSQNYGKMQDHNWQASDDPEDASATVRELVNAAVDMMNDEIRTLMPASFMEQVKIINSPPAITWQKLLKKYIGTISASTRKTRTKLNRRQPERFDLPGRIDDKVLKIVVAIDTSASVTEKELSYIFNEIFAILAKRKHDITVIECDAKVQRIYKAKTVRDIKAKVTGRGGTLFTPVIEHINNGRYYRDALLIYFTDGYGEPKIPRPRTYRNLWVVLGDADRLSLKEPYGVKIAL